MISAKRKRDFDTPTRAKRISGVIVSFPEEVIEKIILACFADLIKSMEVESAEPSEQNFTISQETCDRFYRVFAMFTSSLTKSKAVFYYTRAKIWSVVTRGKSHLGVWGRGIHLNMAREIAVTPCFQQRIKSLWCCSVVTPHLLYQFLALPIVELQVPNDLFMQGIFPFFRDYGTPARMSHLKCIKFSTYSTGVLRDEDDNTWSWDPNYWHEHFPVLDEIRMNNASFSKIWRTCPGVAASTFPAVHNLLMDAAAELEDLTEADLPITPTQMYNNKRFMRYLVFADPETFMELCRAYLSQHYR